jgi:hypothetical protein
LNALFAAATSKEFLELSDHVVPPTLMETYLAFDAGEYIHPGDSAGDNYELKYTRPMIEALLDKFRGA